MLPLHSVVYYYYFRNITGTSNKDPTSKMSCGRSRGFDGSQRFAHDTFPSCGRKPGTEHSPYQLTEISWQDDGSPIIGRWLAAALRPHYGKMMACRYSADGWLPPYGRITSADGSIWSKCVVKGKKFIDSCYSDYDIKFGIDIWLKDIIIVFKSGQRRLAQGVSSLFFGDEMTWISQLGFHIDSEILTMYCLRFKMANIY